MKIIINGADELAADLGGLDLAPVIRTIGMAVGAEMRDRIAPYPAAPARRTDRWYERGYGQRWRRADGSIGGRATSETLGRRWKNEARPAGAELTNLASYSGFIHAADSQARRMGALGWKTDRGIAAELHADGTIERIASAALGKAITTAIGES